MAQRHQGSARGLRGRNELVTPESGQRPRFGGRHRLDGDPPRCRQRSTRNSDRRGRPPGPEPGARCRRDIQPRLQRHRHHPRPVRSLEIRTALRSWHGGGRRRRRRGVWRRGTPWTASDRRHRRGAGRLRVWRCSMRQRCRRCRAGSASSTRRRCTSPTSLVGCALRERGRLRPARSSLSTPPRAAWARGSVQLAKAFGAVVIATAGTDEKVDFCRQLGADHAVNYRTEDFVGYVDDVTNGRGVDLAFDSVGGQVTKDTFRTMAFNGRHLIVGFAADIALEESRSACSRASTATSTSSASALPSSTILA